MKMGRYPKVSWPIVKKKKKGGWSEEEDLKLAKFINNHGLQGINWETISHKAGLNRCGKSCRLRWKNYLSPHIRRGNFSEQEVSIIIHLHSRLGNKWSQIAAKLPGRTDNDIKNFWNTKLRKKLRQKASTEYSSQPHSPTTDHNFLANYLISIFSIFLGFFNMPQSEVAQNLLLHLQEWERKQQELMVMASTPNYPFLPDTSTISQPGFGLGNELDSGTSTIPLETHTNLTSDAWFEGGLLANFFDSNIAGNDLTQYHMLPALVSASDDEFQTPMADEFYVNPNSVASFDHEWVATEMNYQCPDDLGSAMQKKEILASCLGLSPSFMGSASSSNIYDAASSSFYDDFQS